MCATPRSALSDICAQEQRLEGTDRFGLNTVKAFDQRGPRIDGLVKSIIESEHVAIKWVLVAMGVQTLVIVEAPLPLELSPDLKFSVVLTQ